MKIKKLVVDSSNFIDIYQIGTDGYYELYELIVNDSKGNLHKFKVGYYDVIGPNEPQLWLFDDKKKIMIGSVKRLSRNYKKIVIKTAFISYMIGSKLLKIIQ